MYKSVNIMLIIKTKIKGYSHLWTKGYSQDQCEKALRTAHLCLGKITSYTKGKGYTQYIHNC